MGNRGAPCQEPDLPAVRSAADALGIAEAPHAFSAVTWTLRQTSTGLLRKVTAFSEAEARERVALGLFDDTELAR